MIIFNIEDGTLKTFGLGGSLLDISADASLLISLVHSALYKKDKEAAKLFKEGLRDIIATDRLFPDGSLIDSISEDTDGDHTDGDGITNDDDIVDKVKTILDKGDTPND